MGRPKKNKSSQYKITLFVNGLKYNSEGDSILEAIEKLQGKIENYKTRGTLRAELNDKKIERFLFYPQMRKLFDEPTSSSAEISKMLISKSLTEMLK